MLYDTYGVPVELTAELVAQHDMTVDMDGFDTAMQQAKETSRAGAQQKFAKGTDRATHIDGLPPTIFVGYEHTDIEDFAVLKDIHVGEQRVIVLDRTPFYAES